MSDNLEYQGPTKIETLLVFALTLAALLAYADRTGYEGDDINSILPMLHLRAALAGDLLIYRPDWQPLSYEIGAAVYALTGSVNAIFALAQLGVAAGVALLYNTTRYVGLTPILFIPVLMMFPEIVYSGLYYNSSALGFPLVCLAVLLAFSGSGRAAAAVIGAVLAVAVLIRIDFVLVAPVVMATRLWIHRDLWEVFIAALTAGVVFLSAVAVGLLDPIGVIETYAMARAEIIAKGEMPGWDDRSKIFVISVVLSPVGWIFLAAATIWFVGIRRVWLPATIGLICLAPMLFAARNMLTAKYMLPAFALLPVIAAVIWVDASKYLSPIMRRWLTGLWCAATVFFLVFALEPTKQEPHVKIALYENRQIGTHDGHRSWGAYLWQMGRVKNANLERYVGAKDLLTAVLLPRVGPLALVGRQSYFTPGGLAWRNLQLALENAGYSGQLVGSEALRFDLPSGPLFLLTSASMAGHVNPNICTIMLSDASSRAQISACAKAKR